MAKPHTLKNLFLPIVLGRDGGVIIFSGFLRGFSAETTFSRTFGLHRGHVLADAARSSGRSDRALGADSSSVLTSVFVHTDAGLWWFLIKPKVLFSFQHIDLCEKRGRGL